MLIPARPSDSIKLAISRPVLMTHLTPRACKSPISSCSSSGIGGFSNSAKMVPSKSVESSLMGKVIEVVRCGAFLFQPILLRSKRKSLRASLRFGFPARNILSQFRNEPSNLDTFMNKLRIVRFCAVVALAWALYGPAHAGEPAAARKVASVEGITEYQLDNGLRVLLFPDNSQSKVTVNMTVLVGSRQEGYGETGMAHLLEHMVFKGTPRHPKVPKALQEHGAQFNGSTSSDRVNYFETLAATDENLEFAIDLEADRMVNSYIKQEDLDSEMTVVRNEFERGENSPGAVLSERISAAAYDWHNYGKPTIGNRTDIERVPVENLRAFYKKYYQPDNVVLIVAGKFEEGKALALIQKYFGPIPRPERKLNTTWTEEPAQDGERQVTLRLVGDLD